MKSKRAVTNLSAVSKTRSRRNWICYDVEVGENRVRVFYGTEKREGERLEIYTGGIGPCSSTVYQICNISPAQIYL